MKRMGKDKSNKVWKTNAVYNEKNNIIYIQSRSSPEAVSLLLENARQLQLRLTEVAALVGQKNNRSDFTAQEWDQLADCFQQVLYINHSLNRQLKAMQTHHFSNL
ncbi:MAG: hypothetical protein E6X17_11800 [Sporomusaceae bacterium]|nr:hypothetical protein [Sporomusaceae bacterium]